MRKVVLVPIEKYNQLIQKNGSSTGSLQSDTIHQGSNNKIEASHKEKEDPVPMLHHNVSPKKKKKKRKVKEPEETVEEVPSSTTIIPPPPGRPLKKKKKTWSDLWK